VNNDQTEETKKQRGEGKRYQRRKREDPLVKAPMLKNTLHLKHSRKYVRGEGNYMGEA